jgi:hypothetical protein
MQRLVLLAAAAVLASACTVRPQPQATPLPAPPAAVEWDRELDASWQLHDVGESGVTSVIPMRVLDDATGAPIALARIDNWDESDTPHAEPWDNLRAGTWTTDADGFALVPTTDRAPWWFVEAPGYGPRAEMSFEDERRLMRGVDVPIEVRDWRERPVPGAVVEALLGCGHTPTVRAETAGPDGRLVFRGIDPSHATDLWVLTPGLAGRNPAYWGGGPDELPVENGVYVLHCDPSAVIEGRVLRADGSPAANAVVGSYSAHRGPWTVADADGRFRLVGAEPYAWAIARAPLADPVREGFDPPRTEFQSVPGVVATVRLPADGKRTPTKEEREAERAKARAESKAREEREAAGIEEPDPPVPAEGPGVRLRITATEAAAARGHVTVVLVRDGDGAAEIEWLKFKDGAATRAVAVGAGEWKITAGDVAGGLRPASRSVSVGPGWTDVEFVLAPNPVWTLRWSERTADGPVRALVAPPKGKLFVVTADGEADATPAGDPAKDDAMPEAIRIPAEGPFALRVRTEDRPDVRQAFEGRPRDDAVLVLPAPEPQNDSEEDENRMRDFAPARFTVLLPDGRPHAGARITVRTPPSISGTPPRSAHGGWRSLDLDDAGSAESGFDRAEILEFEHDPDAPGLVVLPFTTRVTGPGPWTFSWPTGEVVVRAKDEQGVPYHDFEVSLGGWDTVTPRDGAVRIVGAAPGPLRLWVAREGCVAHDVRLVLADGERREVVVRLRPRRR